MIEVFAPGSPVQVLRPDGEVIQATIDGVTIRSNSYVVYECIWWDGYQRHEAWVSAVEVGPAKGSIKIRIGFHEQETAR